MGAWASYGCWGFPSFRLGFLWVPGLPMAVGVFLHSAWVSYGCLGFRWLLGFAFVSLGFPMGAWVSYGCWDLPSFRLGFLWAPGFPMNFTWVSYGFTIWGPRAGD